MEIHHYTMDNLRNVHAASQCAGENCITHNPSEHHMLDWDLGVEVDSLGVAIRDNRFGGVPIILRVCPHELLHPDPDSLAYFVRQGLLESGEHLGDCDGCCVPRPLALGE